MLETLRNDIMAARQAKTQCVVGRFYNTMDSSDQKLLIELLDDNTITAGELADALQEKAANAGLSFHFTDQGVGRHRRRGRANGCLCP